MLTYMMATKKIIVHTFFYRASSNINEAQSGNYKHESKLYCIFIGQIHTSSGDKVAVVFIFFQFLLHFFFSDVDMKVIVTIQEKTDSNRFRKKRKLGKRISINLFAVTPSIPILHSP